jgi:hypothetical protein
VQLDEAAHQLQARCRARLVGRSMRAVELHEQLEDAPSCFGREIFFI